MTDIDAADETPAVAGDAATTGCDHRECAHAWQERFFTPATQITFVRTIATVVIGLIGAREDSLTLLLVALGTHWFGDSLDGIVARVFHHETRIGAALDIMCDRLACGVFYIGFAWYDPTMVAPIGIYLFEFMVIDLFLSLAFLSWPLKSPDYFYVVDRRIWLWNWSRPGKTLNSALFAIVLVWTRDPWITSAIATGIIGLKLTSLYWLHQVRLPIPGRCAHQAVGAG